MGGWSLVKRVASALTTLLGPAARFLPPSALLLLVRGWSRRRQRQFAEDSREAAKETAREMGRLAVRRLRSAAPRKTGKLRRSIRVRVRRTPIKRGDRDAPTFRFSPRMLDYGFILNARKDTAWKQWIDKALAGLSDEAEELWRRKLREERAKR